MFSQHHDGLLQLLVTGLFHPENDHGVRCVSEETDRSDERPLSFFPQRGSYPPKNSPYQQPYRITAAVTFLPLLRILREINCLHSRLLYCSPQASKPEERRPDVPTGTARLSSVLVVPSATQIALTLYLPRCSAVAAHPAIPHRVRRFCEYSHREVWARFTATVAARCRYHLIEMR